MIVELKKHVNLLVICSFVVLAGLSMSLLLSTHNIMGAGDLPMHLHQLREVQLALDHLQWPFYGVNEFHGSAIMTLYPWLNLWPMVVMALFVKNHLLVIYLFFMLTEFVTLMISYFSSLAVNHSRKISYLFAIFYGLSTLYLDYGFSDLDWGELLTMTFFPLVIFGSVLLLKRQRWIMLSVGMSLVISSHVLNTLIVIAVIALLLVINIDQWTPNGFFNLLKAAVTTLLATTVIWLPAVMTMMQNRPMTTPPADSLYGTPFRDVVTSSYDGTVSYGISLFALIGLTVGVLFFFRLNRYLKQWTWLSLFLVMMCSAWFPWYRLPKILMHLQFTWRLSFIPELLLSYVAASVLGRYLKSSALGYLGMVFLLMIAIVVQFQGQRQIINVNLPSRPYDTRYLNRKTLRYGHHPQYKITRFDVHNTKNIKVPPAYRLNGNRSYNLLLNNAKFMNTKPYYWRQRTKRRFSDVNDNFVRGPLGVSVLKRVGYNEFTFRNPRFIRYALLPILKYRGEQLQIDENGRRIPYSTQQGTLRLSHVAPGQHTLSINVIQTGHRYLLSYIASVVGLMIYLLIMIKVIHRKNVR